MSSEFNPQILKVYGIDSIIIEKTLSKFSRDINIYIAWTNREIDRIKEKVILLYTFENYYHVYIKKEDINCIIIPPLQEFINKYIKYKIIEKYNEQFVVELSDFSASFNQYIKTNNIPIPIKFKYSYKKIITFDTIIIDVDFF